MKGKRNKYVEWINGRKCWVNKKGQYFSTNWKVQAVEMARKVK